MDELNIENVLAVLLFIVLVLLAAALLIALMYTIIIYPMEIVTCSRLQAINPELNYEMHYWLGCFVELPNGLMINANDYPAYMDIQLNK